jgi:hypothetical protein
MAISVTERRSARRFEIRLSLIVRWTSGSAVGEAVTKLRDVSSRGVYFLSPKDIKHGSPVEIVMTLPHEITRVGPVKVRCLGRIQRTEGGRGGSDRTVRVLQKRRNCHLDKFLPTDPRNWVREAEALRPAYPQNEAPRPFSFCR